MKNLVQRGIPVVSADWNIDPQAVACIRSRDGGGAELAFIHVDVSDFHEVMSVFHQYPDITDVIHRQWEKMCCRRSCAQAGQSSVR